MLFAIEQTLTDRNRSEQICACIMLADSDSNSPESCSAMWTCELELQKGSEESHLPQQDRGGRLRTRRYPRLGMYNKRSPMSVPTGKAMFDMGKKLAAKIASPKKAARPSFVWKL